MFYVFFLVIAPPQLWESQRLGGIPPEKALVPTIPGAGSSKSTHARDSICAHLARPTMQRSVQYIRNTTRKRPREWMVFAYIIYNMHPSHSIYSAMPMGKRALWYYDNHNSKIGNHSLKYLNITSARWDCNQSILIVLTYLYTILYYYTKGFLSYQMKIAQTSL